jgi:hypothetical protein
MDRGGFVDRSEADAHTLSDVLKRYLKEVTPSKKGHVAESFRIRSILRSPISQLRMSVLTSSHIAGFRDEWSRTVSPGTVNRDLTTLSHAIQTARREWEIYMPDSPAYLLRRMRAPLARSRRL